MPAIAMTYTPDLRSSAWLASSIRFARLEYRSTQQLATEIVEADAVQELLSMLMTSLSNRQVQESGQSAASWMADLVKCEEESELPVDLQKMKAAAQVLCDLCERTRCARGSRRQ